VLDSSAALAWVLPDEGGAAAALLDRVAETGAVVPSLWPFEVANGLLMAQRRGRITATERQQALALLAELPISIEPADRARLWTDTLALAEAWALTIYDASYLEAAHRLALPLASFDAALRRAAGRCNVPVLG
jgi:predicted nucleic acid-binding protein